jgi:hypothetical protein
MFQISSSLSLLSDLIVWASKQDKHKLKLFIQEGVLKLKLTKSLCLRVYVSGPQLLEFEGFTTNSSQFIRHFIVHTYKL